MPRPRSRQSKKPHKEDAALGARLKALRQERGITQAELAEKIGVDQRTVSFYELGHIRIPARELLKISGVLRASLKEFAEQSGASAADASSRKLLQLVEKVKDLPPRKQRQVTEYIDLLSKASEA